MYAAGMTPDFDERKRRERDEMTKLEKLIQAGGLDGADLKSLNDYKRSIIGWKTLGFGEVQNALAVIISLIERKESAREQEKILFWAKIAAVAGAIAALAGIVALCR
jgi:hypothetical protein